MTAYNPLSTSLAHTFAFDLLDNGLGRIGALHPDAERPPQLTNRPTGAVKRQMTGFRLPPDEARDINVVTDRVRVWYVPVDGSEPTALATLCWADAKWPTFTYGADHDGTLHDFGLILGQAIEAPVSFPVGSIVGDAMFQVALWAGFGDAAIDPSEALFIAPQAWDASQANTYYKILATLAKDHAGFYDPYFDAMGRLVIRDPGDITAIVPAIQYPLDDRSRVDADSVTITHNLMQAPDRYVVRDTSAQPAAVIAVYDVPDTAPHAYARRKFHIIRYIDVQGVTSAEKALQIAQNAARTDPDTFEEASWSSVIDPRHGTFDVVRLGDDDYLESEWSMRLDPGGKMTHKGKRIKHAELRLPGGIVANPPTAPPTNPGDPEEPEPQPETVISTYQAEDMQLIGGGTSTPADTFPLIIQGENTAKVTLVNPAPTNGMTIQSATAGFNGTGYVGRWNQAGEIVRISYNSGQARTAGLIFRHNAAALAARILRVNGVVVTNALEFASTAGGWATSTQVNVPLTAGVNQIELEVPSSSLVNVNLDQVEVTVELDIDPPGGGTGSGIWEINAQGRFVNPDGQRTRLVGINAALQEFGPNDAFIFNYPIRGGGGRRSFANVADLKRWGFNIVRLTIVAGASPGGVSAVASKIADFVEDAAAEGIVVMPCDFTYGVGHNMAGSAMTTTNAFWTAVINACGDNPYLWVNYHNEPVGNAHPTAIWRDMANYGYSLIRGLAKGADTMFVMDAGISGQDGIGAVTSGDWSTFAAGKHHAALSWHAYMAGKTAANIESDRAAMNAANVPWMVGEFAYQPNHPGAACCGGTYDNQRAGSLKIINEWIPAGESAIWWIGTGDSSGTAQHSLSTPDGTYQDDSVFASQLGLSEPGSALWAVAKASHAY